MAANYIPYGGTVSLNDIQNVFGPGKNLNPGSDLNDYHGVQYFHIEYPYVMGYFNVNINGQLSLDDFRGKTATDPAAPGSFVDYVPGTKSFTLPVFRNTLTIELWGAGGGGSAGHHDYTPPSGGNGTESNISLSYFYNNATYSYSANAHGGGGGTGGFRYGNQNGSGGGGGTTVATSPASIVATTQNGNSGAGGDAGDGHGGVGGSSYSNPTTGSNGGAGGRAAGPNGNMNGGNGSTPGAGGGGSGWSDFGSKNPDQSAGGGGGSGGYVLISIPRKNIGPGQFIYYTVGTGGTGLVQNNGGATGNGGDGAPGGFKISWN